MFPSYSTKFELDMDFDLQAPEWGIDPAAPSEDFWKKFEELPDLGDDLETFLGMNMNLDLEGISGRTIEDEPQIELDLSGVLTRNQDPLWAGTTTVVAKQPPKPNPTPPPPPPPSSLIQRGAVDRRPKKINVIVARKPAVVAGTPAGTALKQQSAQQLLSVVPRPETPLSPSDSEQEEEKVDVEKLRGVVRLNAGNKQPPRRIYTTAASLSVDSLKRKMPQTGRNSNKVVPKYTIAPHMDDHNYEYEKSSSVKTSVKPEDLGVVTPSDSEDDQRSSASEEDEEEEEEEEEGEEEDDEEEEIDVVSLSRDSLPTNPSLEIRRQLQNKVASAITTNTLLSASRAVSKRLNQKRCKRKRPNSDDEDFEEREITIKLEAQDDEDPLCLRGAINVSSTSRTGSLPATPQHSNNHYFQYHRSRGTSSASSTPRAASTSSAASSTSTTPRRYAKPHKKSRFSDSEPSTEKRHMHNNMERMRRIDLRNAFEDLRELIPNLMGVQRAAKVSILKDATSYLYELRQKEKTLHQQVSALRGHQDKLRSTLSQLRRSLAAKR